ncbi:hypothetical protein DV515_00016070 [Chloebia gouldiae]|uniref:TNFR-Cys domain-containing protein n=1 Tax=Chloebia gouldiae TaxID=44316 RepID=A0A3L8RU18_CHLGU|nr:hypothetical protein DV515_00016070 [Chloebia gouldiae]
MGGRILGSHCSRAFPVSGSSTSCSAFALGMGIPGERESLWNGKGNPSGIPAGSPAPCGAAQHRDCKCPPGHSCADEPCQFCRALPRCPPGHEPTRIGPVNFQFECKPCENGTYSSSRGGWCHNWTEYGAANNQ